MGLNPRIDTKIMLNRTRAAFTRKSFLIGNIQIAEDAAFAKGHLSDVYTGVGFRATYTLMTSTDSYSSPFGSLSAGSGLWAFYPGFIFYVDDPVTEYADQITRDAANVITKFILYARVKDVEGKIQLFQSPALWWTE